MTNAELGQLKNFLEPFIEQIKPYIESLANYDNEEERKKARSELDRFFSAQIRKRAVNTTAQISERLGKMEECYENICKGRDFLSNFRAIYSLGEECVNILIIYIRLEESGGDYSKGWAEHHINQLLENEKKADKLKERTTNRRINVTVFRIQFDSLPYANILRVAFGIPIGMALMVALTMSNQDRQNMISLMYTIGRNLEAFCGYFLKFLRMVTPAACLSQLGACKDAFAWITIVSVLITVCTFWRKSGRRGVWVRLFLTLLMGLGMSWSAFMATWCLVSWNVTKGWLTMWIILLNVILGIFFFRRFRKSGSGGKTP